MTDSQDESVDRHFDEMKERYENFVRPLSKVRHVKVNVFYHIINEDRTKKELVQMARGTHPFIVEQVWSLLDEFMEFMRNLPGVEGENYRAIYHGYTPADLVKRLLFKRPLVFIAARDRFMLRFNGYKNIEGSNGAHKVAKTLESQPDGDGYCLKEYISYDENLLSSLINMSTPTFYVSDGSVKKIGANSRHRHIDRGILCGLVGARNKKIGFMENRFIIPRSAKSSTDVHLSDQFWITRVYPEAFPEGFIPTLEHIENNRRIYEMIYVDGINVAYLERRLMLSIAPYIKEAEVRGREMGKKVFCSVPPIGGGVWRGNITAEMISNLIVIGVLKLLDQSFDHHELKMLVALALPETNLKTYSSFKPSKNIASISLDSSENSAIVTFKESHAIKIFNSFRYVAQPLPAEFENCLSIAAYAWDGNSYPGNEYWCGGMGSFDPQAIYCSLLGQFQNPEVNINMADADRIKVY